MGKSRYKGPQPPGPPGLVGPIRRAAARGEFRARNAPGQCRASPSGLTSAYLEQEYHTNLKSKPGQFFDLCWVTVKYVLYVVQTHFPGRNTQTIPEGPFYKFKPALNHRGQYFFCHTGLVVIMWRAAARGKNWGDYLLPRSQFVPRGAFSTYQPGPLFSQLHSLAPLLIAQRNNLVPVTRTPARGKEPEKLS